MSHSHDENRLPDGLEDVAETLRSQRPELTPLELDRVKLRAMRAHQSSTSREEGSSMRSRLVTLLTIGALTLGTGGALALAGGNGNTEPPGGSSAEHQYRCENHELPERPGNGFGDENHCHTGPPGHK